jgi:hypothetical protein
MKTVRLSLLLLMAILTTSIRAETINCTPITSLPTTITTQGIYCLTGNLSTSQTSGNAITINANNVTIDLNAWKLGGQGAGTGTTVYGVYSTTDNVTIKNGIVRGFIVGVYLGGRGAVVQDVLADSNTYVGVWVAGLGALVEHNQVVNSGGSTTATNVYAYGIAATGSSSLVSDNMISGITATGTGYEYGIYISGANSTVRDNVISNTILPTGGGASVGIWANQDISLNNTLSNFDYGIFNNSGGIYAYNTANNCTTNYTNGTAGAGNSP